MEQNESEFTIEAYRITVASRDNTIGILVSDLARANLARAVQKETITDLQKQVEDLTIKPTLPTPV